MTRLFKFIAKQLKQNKSNEINLKEVQIKNLSLLENVRSVDENYQTQLDILNNQYHNHVE